LTHQRGPNLLCSTPNSQIYNAPLQSVKWFVFKVTLIVFINALWGCGSRYPRPASFNDDPHSLLDTIKTRGAQVQGLSGALAVEFWEADQRIKVRQLFATQRPLKLRMDTLSPFEQPLATLVCDGERLSLFEMDKRRYLTGPLTAETFERLSKLRVTPQEMTALLSGQVPLLNSNATTVEWDDRRGLYRLTLKEGDRHQVLSIDPSTLTPVEAIYYKKEEVVLKIRLASYSKSEPKIPQRLRIEIPDREIRVDVEIKDFILNPALPPEAFSLPPPAGVRIEEL
jgi:outer membrane lipoprotein-sorting protein